MKVLQMIFCILACLCAAAVIPSAVYLGWYCLLIAGGGVIFAVLMYVCKRAAAPKPLPTPDYFNSEEENARINRERAEHGEE